MILLYKFLELLFFFLSPSSVHRVRPSSRNGMPAMSRPMWLRLGKYRILCAVPLQGIISFMSLCSTRKLSPDERIFLYRSTVIKSEPLIRPSLCRFLRITLPCRNTALYRECTWSCLLSYVSLQAITSHSSSAGQALTLLGVSSTRWPTVKVNKMGSTYPRSLHVLICRDGFQTNGTSNCCPTALILLPPPLQAIRQALVFRTMSVAYFPTPTCAFTKALILCYTAKYLKQFSASFCCFFGFPAVVTDERALCKSESRISCTFTPCLLFLATCSLHNNDNITQNVTGDGHIVKKLLINEGLEIITVSTK